MTSITRYILDKWQEDSSISQDITTRLTMGVDIARFGGDRTWVTYRTGSVITKLLSVEPMDTMDTAKTLWEMAIENGVDAMGVDVIGVGAGVYDRLVEENEQYSERGDELPLVVYPINSSTSASGLTDLSGEVGFVNLRAAGWWLVREIMPYIAIPDEAQLIADLTAPRWENTASGAILIEGKKSMRKRLKRSPDAADSFIICLLLDAVDLLNVSAEKGGHIIF